MTSRQAKHQAKQRADGAVTIAVTFRADEPEAAMWFETIKKRGGPKAALKWLLIYHEATKNVKISSNQHDQIIQNCLTSMDY
jgi:hypothetical protein